MTGTLLKLHAQINPKDNIIQLCRFLNIPFHEQLLHVTANGAEFVNYETKNFDPAPVKKMYYSIISKFDWYRLEASVYHIIRYFNYETFFYDPKTNLPCDALLKLYIKMFNFELYNVNPDQVKRTEEAKVEMMKHVSELYKLKDDFPDTNNYFNFAQVLHPES